MNFKKRRPRPAHNKNEAKVRRGMATTNRPTLSEAYKDVEQLSVQMEFYTHDGQLLSQQIRDFLANDPMELVASCPGRCGNGKTDMEGKIRSMISSLQTNSMAKATCPEILLAGTSDTCQCELRCSIEIRYKS